MEYKIRLKRGTSTQWQSANPLLDAGEMGLETNTGKIKIGDGSTYWNDLAYGPAISVSDLTDAQISSLANGQILKYDSSQQKWLNHTLIKSDLGLTNVDNTADTEKPISNATQTALDLKANSADVYTKSQVDTSLAQKVESNSAISGSTATKITYDSKGLVTSSSDAVLDDLSDVTITSPALNQILKFNGSQWINAPTSTVSPSAGLTYFLTRTSAGTTPYSQLMSFNPDTNTEVDENISVDNNTVEHHCYVSDVAIGKSSIDAGVWEFNIYTYVSGHSAYWQFKILKRDTNGVETELFSVNSPTFSNTSVELLVTSTVQPSFVCNPTDKLVFRQFGTSNYAVTMHFLHSGTEHYSHFHTPLTATHNDIAGLQGGATGQYYHLSSSEYTGTGTGTFVRAVSPNITTPTGIVKGDVGLSNVDNTSDMSKPVSTQQDAYIKQTAYYYAIVL